MSLSIEIAIEDLLHAGYYTELFFFLTHNLTQSSTLPMWDILLNLF